MLMTVVVTGLAQHLMRDGATPILHRRANAHRVVFGSPDCVFFCNSCILEMPSNGIDRVERDTDQRAKITKSYRR